MPQTMSTQLEWIAEKAKTSPDFKFRSLAHHIGVNYLEEAYHKLKKGKAPGIDGRTVREYGMNLRDNLAALHERLKTNRYRATPVKRVMIPKGKKGQRPLGLPIIEDKLIQMAVKMMLEPIYEQDFLDCSYGFRPGRNCHQAVSAVRENCMSGMRWVIDADISKCFDSLDHTMLQELLQRRVMDGSIKRLVGKWLNAGIMDGNSLIFPQAGTPQGGVLTPRTQ